jgi:hypothetical protein
MQKQEITMSDNIDKPTKEELVESFLDIVIESFTDWIVDATRVIRDLKSEKLTASTHISAPHLRKIDTSIAFLRKRINDLYLSYKELEEEYKTEIFSVEYFSQFSEQMKDISEIVDSIKLVANEYQSVLENYKLQKVDIDKYVTPSNQKSIEFLVTLDDQKLFEILEKGEFSEI